MNNEKKFKQVMLARDYLFYLTLVSGVIVLTSIYHFELKWWTWPLYTLGMLFVWGGLDDVLYNKAIKLDNTYYEHHRSLQVMGRIFGVCILMLLVGYFVLGILTALPYLIEF